MQVEKCSRCVLVLGVVQAAVSVSNCDSITVITACRRLQVRYIVDTCIAHVLAVLTSSYALYQDLMIMYLNRIIFVA